MAKDKQLDIVRDLVIGLIPRLDRRKKVEDLAREVGKMYRVIFREVRDVEFEEFTALAMPPAPEPSKRAKPYVPRATEGAADKDMAEPVSSGKVRILRRRIKGKKRVEASRGFGIGSPGLDRRR